MLLHLSIKILENREVQYKNPIFRTLNSQEKLKFHRNIDVILNIYIAILLLLVDNKVIVKKCKDALAGESGKHG
jgi:hypothetical protein